MGRPDEPLRIVDTVPDATKSLAVDARWLAVVQDGPKVERTHVFVFDHTTNRPVLDFDAGGRVSDLALGGGNLALALDGAVALVELPSGASLGRVPTDSIQLVWVEPDGQHVHRGHECWRFGSPEPVVVLDRRVAKPWSTAGGVASRAQIEALGRSQSVAVSVLEAQQVAHYSRRTVGHRLDAEPERLLDVRAEGDPAAKAAALLATSAWVRVAAKVVTPGLPWVVSSDLGREHLFVRQAGIPHLVPDLPGTTEVLFDTTLNSAARIYPSGGFTLRVVDAAGAPVAGATLYTAQTGSASRSPVPRGVTDAAGVYHDFRFAGDQSHYFASDGVRISPVGPGPELRLDPEPWSCVVAGRTLPCAAAGDVWDPAFAFDDPVDWKVTGDHVVTLDVPRSSVVR